MSFRVLRNFIAWCMLAFIVLVVWRLYQFTSLSLSLRDARIDAIAAVIIITVHFVAFRFPEERAPRPRRFLGQVFIRLLGLYIILAAWSGASYELMHNSLGKQDLQAILVTNLPSAPIAVIFVFWVVFSAWWSAYALVASATTVPATAVVPAGPVPSRREKSSFLTLDIYPRQ